MKEKIASLSNNKEDECEKLKAELVKNKAILMSVNQELNDVKQVNTDFK